MSPVVKNIIAVVIGLIIGSVVNMGIIMLSGSIIPLPEGVDATNMESLKSGMHLFEFKHFIFPFLAHAIGTLAGAYLTTRLAASHHLKFALLVGAFFLIGGIMNVIQLPSPVWFTVVDLVMAYFPMAWLGWQLGQKSI